MTDASTSAPPPAHSFRPQSAEALWRQISTPHPTVGKARHLGEALVHAGLLSTPDLAQGLQAQQEERGNGVQRPIGQILVDRGALTRDQLRSVIATWLGEYTVHPGDITPEASALALIPRAVAERESVLPLIARDDALVLLMADPWDRVLIDEIRFLTQRRLIPLRASPGTLMPAIHKAYRTQPGDTAATGRARHLAGAADQPDHGVAGRRYRAGRRDQRVGQHPGAAHQFGDRRGRQPQGVGHPHRDETGSSAYLISAGSYR